MTDLFAKKVNLGFLQFHAWVLVALLLYWWVDNDLIHDGTPFVGMADDVAAAVLGIVLSAKKAKAR